MKVLGIIPARGGSKGVPRKNVRLLCGKPLLQYTAEAALAAKRLARVVLSTEDEEIAEVGRHCGLDVPFLRPLALAKDDTPTLPVLQDVVRRLATMGEVYDAVCLLQPTSPLRPATLIDSCIERLEATHADAVVTILPVPAEHNPHWTFFQDADGCLTISTGETVIIPRRQLLPPAFHREGSVYVTRYDVLMNQNSLYGKRLYGVPVLPGGSVNIDTLADWAKAESLILRRSPVVCVESPAS